MSIINVWNWRRRPNLESLSLNFTDYFIIILLYDFCGRIEILNIGNIADKCYFLQIFIVL